MPTARAQFASAAGLAMLVLVVHSAHMHAAGSPHDLAMSAPVPDLNVGLLPALGAREFLDHTGAIAGCMTLEFCAPRILALALVAAGLLALVTSLAATGQRFPRLGIEIARPPPGTRRQALLGVFLS
jgi:hypothetical protein